MSLYCILKKLEDEFSCLVDETLDFSCVRPFHHKIHLIRQASKVTGEQSVQESIATNQTDSSNDSSSRACLTKSVYFVDGPSSIIVHHHHIDAYTLEYLKNLKKLHITKITPKSEETTKDSLSLDNSSSSEQDDCDDSREEYEDEECDKLIVNSSNESTQATTDSLGRSNQESPSSYYSNRQLRYYEYHGYEDTNTSSYIQFRPNDHNRKLIMNLRSSQFSTYVDDLGNE